MARASLWIALCLDPAVPLPGVVSPTLDVELYELTESATITTQRLSNTHPLLGVESASVCPGLQKRASPSLEYHRGLRVIIV